MSTVNGMAVDSLAITHTSTLTPSNTEYSGCSQLTVTSVSSRVRRHVYSIGDGDGMDLLSSSIMVTVQESVEIRTRTVSLVGASITVKNSSLSRIASSIKLISKHCLFSDTLNVKTALSKS